MKNRYFVLAALLSTFSFSGSACAQSSNAGKPFALQCDALEHAIGDDNAAPHLSWKIQDVRVGARQSAYRITVASTAALLTGGHADVWDSGRMQSDMSVDVAYAGPQLKPETRYYWRVQAWDHNGKPYPASDVSWWETGLMGQDHWLGQWIGYEDREQSAIRAANAQWVTNPKVDNYQGKGETRHDLRLSFESPTAARAAILYVTGEDTASAWLNGAQVMQPEKQPPWGRGPWRTYRRVDIAGQVHAGANVLAIEIMHYEGGRTITPVNAVLYIENADGSTRTFKTGGPGWKSNFEAAGNWQSAGFDDSAWPAPMEYPATHDAFGGGDVLGIPLPTASVAALRHGFQLNKAVVSARLYATALGAYKFNLNGKEVSDQVLAPNWTDYRQRVFYQTYDVTSLLAKGENVIGAYLAPGWYSTPLEWVGQGNNYGATPAALKAQLKITYSDGSAQWISTDSTWKADISPILSAEIYNGETYDARRMQKGWDRPGFADAKWHSVKVIDPHEPEILWQSFQPIRAIHTIHPVSVTSPQAGVYIYDFGQNFAGVPRISLRGHVGSTVRLRFGELLNSDGTLYTANLRNAKATDYYTFASDGVETYEPSFTFHGFRYMELTGAKERPGSDAIEAVVLHTDAPISAQLSTGSAIVNQLWKNILWGQYSNFLGVPTDCPQRDERLGWSADAQVFWRAASYNMDLTAFSRKYAGDLRGTLGTVGMFGIYAPGTGKVNSGFGPGWSDAGIIVPWTSWIQSGDKTIIDQNWSGMERYLATILAANSNYLWSQNRGINFGDWLSPEGTTSDELIATAYWAYDAKLMSQMAHAAGRTEDERKYADLYAKISDAFRRAYIHPGGVVAWQKSASQVELVESQTGYVLALHMDLLPEEMRAQAAQRLVDRIAKNGWKLGTGFLGTPYLLEVLCDTQHADVAYRLLLNTQYPSWGYMIEHGATTMWERWNGDKMLGDPGMNSFNHYAYGAVAEWLYRYAAGVDTTELDAGFHTILLHPNFDSRIGKVDFSYESRYGSIHSKWEMTGGNVEWQVAVPANTTARVLIPSADKSSYVIDGKSLQESPLAKQLPGMGNFLVYELAAGRYNLHVHMSPDALNAE